VALLFLESTSEIFFILVVALIIFGPRKLPQLSKTIGKSLAEFKRASEEFKRTWEQEVEMDTTRRPAAPEPAMLSSGDYSSSETVGRGSVTDEATVTETVHSEDQSEPHTMLAEADTHSTSEPPVVAAAAEPVPAPTRKRDWL
jgi:TatA/E family protein of Tat protein translocase